MLNQFYSNNPKFFTILCNEETGFTDQLMEFNSLYKFGLSLDYRYVHTHLKSPRSTQGNDDNLIVKIYSKIYSKIYRTLSDSDPIFDFLGFNDYFSLKLRDLRLKEFQVVSITLDGNLLENNNLKTFQELQLFVKNFVSTQSSSNTQAVLVKLKTDLTKSSWKLHTLIQSEIRDFPDRLDLRTLYFKTKTNSPISSKFIEKKLKLLVHIRAGDKSIIETPWGTFIKLWGDDKLNEFKKIDDFDVLSDEDYYRFLKNLISNFDEKRLSIIISSDGYKRGFRNIYYNLHRFNFTSSQIGKLKKAEKSCDLRFEKFKDIKNSVCLVGENKKNLYDLVHSSLTANIIIIGAGNAMIPKLMTNYYKLSNPPIIIYLYKAKEGYSLNFLDFVRVIGLDSRKARIIPINLSDNNVEDIIAKLSLTVLSEFNLHSGV